MESDLCSQIALKGNLVVGAKQLAKALKADAVSVIYIAQDAERHVIDPIVSSAAQNVRIVKIESMERLGKACGIQVGAAVAGILKDGE